MPNLETMEPKDKPVCWDASKFSYWEDKYWGNVDADVLPLAKSTLTPHQFADFEQLVNTVCAVEEDGNENYRDYLLDRLAELMPEMLMRLPTEYEDEARKGFRTKRSRVLVEWLMQRSNADEYDAARNSVLPEPTVVQADNAPDVVTDSANRVGL